MRRARSKWWSVLLGGALLLAWFGAQWLKSSRRAEAARAPQADSPGAPAQVRVTAQPSDALPKGNSSGLLGERILLSYANTNLPLANDLSLMSRLMENFLLLVKADRPLSANEDWAAAFTGANPRREQFLPRSHVALNDRGQLVDRWGTPLFFHALGGHRFEIRSAGPDGRLWTQDDLQRNADGSFHRGASMPPSK